MSLLRGAMKEAGEAVRKPDEIQERDRRHCPCVEAQSHRRSGYAIVEVEATSHHQLT
jgi:hypothetical protein